MCQVTHYVVLSIVCASAPLSEQEHVNSSKREATRGIPSFLDSLTTFMQSGVKDFGFTVAMLGDNGFEFVHNYA